MVLIILVKMSKEKAIKIFEQKQVHTFWDEIKELCFISVIDVIEVLKEQNARESIGTT